MSISSQSAFFLPAARLLYQSFPQNPSTLSLANHSILSGFLQAYEESNDTVFLQAALAHVQAYFELSSAFPDNPVQTSSALLLRLSELLQLTPEELLTPVIHTLPCIQPTVNRLNSILGRWPASPYNSHRKSEAVRDILSRIQEHIIGSTYYRAAPRKRNQMKEFKLVINEKQILLYDCLQYKIYLFDDIKINNQ